MNQDQAAAREYARNRYQLLCETDHMSMQIDGIETAFLAGIAYRDSQDKWIAVGEQMPENDITVLCIHTAFDCPFIADYTSTGWRDMDDDIIMVTHWQSLPSPPSKETTNK